MQRNAFPASATPRRMTRWPARPLLAVAAALAVLPLLGWEPLAPAPLPVVGAPAATRATGNEQGLVAEGGFAVGEDAFAWQLFGRMSEHYEYRLEVYHVAGGPVALRVVEARLDFGEHGEARTDGRSCACSVVAHPAPRLQVPLGFLARDDVLRLPEMEGTVTMHFATYHALPLGGVRGADAVDAGLVRVPGRR